MTSQHETEGGAREKTDSEILLVQVTEALMRYDQGLLAMVNELRAELKQALGSKAELELVVREHAASLRVRDETISELRAEIAALRQKAASRTRSKTNSDSESNGEEANLPPEQEEILKIGRAHV